MDDPKFRKALGRLQGFKDNFPPKAQIHQRFVNEYHQIVTAIQTELNDDLSEFTIPTSDLKRDTIRTGQDWQTGDRIAEYTDDLYCHRDIFLMKLDGLIAYINSYIDDSGKRSIGFK